MADQIDDYLNGIAPSSRGPTATPTPVPNSSMPGIPMPLGLPNFVGGLPNPFPNGIPNPFAPSAPAAAPAPAPVVPAAPPAPTGARQPTPEEQGAFLMEWVQKHGPLAGPPIVTSEPMERDPTMPASIATMRPTAEPKMLYRFEDGSTVEARWDGTKYTPIDWKPSDEFKKKGEKDKPVVMSPGTSLVDPNTGKAIVTAPERGPTATEQANTAISQGNLDLAREREKREAAHQERQREADAKRDAATAKRDELNLQVQQGKINADAALQRYKEWIEKNVTIPMQIAAEKRQREQEARLKAESQFNQKKAGAEYERDRAKTGLDLGMSMMKLHQEQQKYSFGPTFPEEWAANVNKLANRDFSSPINFTADAFRMEAPDYDAIAQRAMATALGAISPWAQSLAQQPVEPTAPIQTSDLDAMNATMQGAPTGVYEQTLEP